MSIKKHIIKVYDMTCTSCEGRVESSVKKLNGIKSVKADFGGQYVLVEYEDEQINMNKIKAAINDAGYSTERSNDYKFIGVLIIAAIIVLFGFNTSGINMDDKLNNASYAVLFLIGVMTSIHCVGMCGGIMLSQCINNENKSKFDAVKPAMLYNLGRVISYTVLGGIIGAVGSVFSMSITTKAAIQIFAGVFMIIMGLNMAGFSWFKKLQIKLPNFACKARNKSKSPFVVGILNGLMPCGPLQTMQLFALGAGSAYKGAMSMFIFSIGTVPLMLAFGAMTGLLSKGYTKKILKFSGVLVIVLGLIMSNRGLTIYGINLTPSKAMALSKNSTLEDKTISADVNSGIAVMKDGYQEIEMTADNNGYTPNVFYVQKGVPVKWIINGDKLNSCNNSIIIPSLNREISLQKGENIIEFETGDEDINFSCWMGMIGGVIKVVDSLDSTKTSTLDTALPASGSGPSCCTIPQ